MDRHEIFSTALRHVAQLCAENVNFDEPLA